MVYQPIMGTLGYVMSPDRKKVLLLHRNRKENDYHEGKYNGLGGKVECSEDIATCMRREIKEEAGIDCTKIVLRGTINWEGFGPDGQHWMGFIFRIDGFEGSLLEESAEGTLEWVDINRLGDYAMWEGDKHFLPLVFDEDPRVFHGYMPYKNGKPVSWAFERH